MQHLIRATAAVSNNDASVSFRIAIRTRLDRHLPINSSHGATSSSNGKAKVTDVSGNVIRRLISAYPANDSSLTSTTSSSSVTLITRRYYVAARRGSSTPTPSPQSSTSIRFKYDNGNKDLMDHPPRSTSSLFSTSYSISPIRLLSNTTVSMVDPSHERKCRLPSDFLSTLQDMHPKLSISRNTYDLDSHGHGESYHPTAPPDVVIRPTSVKEIQDILRLCCRIRRCGLDDDDYHDDIPNVEIVSVIPYGAGTSLEGHLQFLLPSESKKDSRNNEGGHIVQIPSSCISNDENDNNTQSQVTVRILRKGGISLDMCNFQSIGEVGDDCFVKVGAGVTRNTLNEALRHTGMQFMVDPGADATIGGMCACAASGTAAVKYGTMRENVMAMTVVLPSTSIATTTCTTEPHSTTDAGLPSICYLGCNALKSSAGYNLSALLTGSEGTLGVITDVTVKLHPIPSHVIAASCAFPDLHSAANAVATIRMMGIPVSRIELLDEMSIQAFNHSLAMEEDGGGGGGGGEVQRVQSMEVTPTLFIEFASHSEVAALEDLAAAQNICINDFGGSKFASASDEPTRKSLWAARHRLYYSAIALRSSSDDEEGPTSQSTIVTDVCVPLSRFAEIISATAKDVREFGVVGPCFGHAGDGNFHCILPLRKNDTKEYKSKVHTIVENMIARAMSMGGTCTGEHGVGYGKKKYLERMYGVGGVALMKAVKKAIDPWNVMNPEKIVDS